MEMLKVKRNKLQRKQEMTESQNMNAKHKMKP